MCDDNGDNMLYTNGSTIWNRNHAVMQNGNGLLGQTSSTQSAIIVPRPGSPSIYYVFTTGASSSNHDLRYSEVDMSLDGGLGAVTANKNILMVGSIGEKVTAVRQANNTDYWIITHGIGNNRFYAYSLTSAGINMTPVISNVGSNYPGQYGSIKVSYSGCRIAGIQRGSGTPFVEVYDFDNQTGTVSNPFFKHTVSSSSLYALEFSPNSELIYVSDGIYPNRSLRQYDLSSGVQATILASMNQVYAGSDWVATPQLGPDGRIYVAKVLHQNLDVIQNPDVPGAGCNYVSNGAGLGGRSSWFGLPQRIPGLESDFSYTNTICDDPYSFSVIDTFPVPMDAVAWDFGDPASGANNTSDERNPSHTFTAPGSYTVQLITTLCNWKDTTTYVIDCTNSTLPVELLSFDATPKANTVRLHWETASERNNDYFLIEKMNAQHDWSFVGTKNSHGDTDELRNYELIDHSPYMGMSYYRLTQFDLDGTSETFPMRSVFFDAQSLIYTDIAAGMLFVQANHDEHIQLTDGFGKVITLQSIGKDNGFLKFDVSSLAKGIYFVQVNNTVEKINIIR